MLGCGGFVDSHFENLDFAADQVGRVGNGDSEAASEATEDDVFDPLGLSFFDWEEVMELLIECELETRIGSHADDGGAESAVEGAHSVFSSNRVYD